MAEIISDAEISALEVKSAGSAKPLGPSIPGVGDPAKQANDIIKKEADKHAKQIKILAGTLLLAVMSGVAVNNISEVNRQIEKLNKFGEKIKATIDDLKNFISQISTVIKIIKVAFLAASIIALIPAVTIGLGAGTAFTMHISVANAIKQACEMLQDKIGKIPFAILSIILLLLSLLKFMDLIMGLVRSFQEQQSDLKNEAILDSLKTSDDWASATTSEDYTDKLKETKDGNREKRLDLMKQLNELEFQVNCTLPDGSVQLMTPSDCLAAGGTFGDNRADLEHELNNLGGPVSGVCLSGPECENLSYEECLNSPNCSWDSGDLIITSLKHPDRNVTIEKAIKQKGKRYGFYGSETGEAPPPPIFTTGTQPEIDVMDKYYQLFPPPPPPPPVTAEEEPPPVTVEEEPPPVTVEEVATSIDASSLEYWASIIPPGWIDVTDQVPHLFALSKAYQLPTSDHWISYPSMGNTDDLKAMDVLVPMSGASGLISDEYNYSSYTVRDIVTGQFSSAEMSWWADPPMLGDELVEIKNFKVYRHESKL